MSAGSTRLILVAGTVGRIRGLKNIEEAELMDERIESHPAPGTPLERMVAEGRVVVPTCSFASSMPTVELPPGMTTEDLLAEDREEAPLLLTTEEQP